MQKIETATEKEIRLNEQLNDMYSESQAIDQFIYLTVVRIGGRTTMTGLRNYYRTRRLGTMLKKFDSLAYSQM